MHNKRLLKFITLLMVLSVFYLSEIQAQVIINEICWTGTQSSTSDEWIELYNHSSSTVDLSGWSIQAADGSPEIALFGIIGSHSYYLLERSDDHTISDITADIIYTGSLGNSGENLSLKNHTTLIDRVDCAGGWFAGDNEDKTSMERIDPSSPGSSPGNWDDNNHSVTNGHDAEGSDIYGTPGHKNSILDTSLPVFITDFRADAENDCIKISWYCQYQDPISMFNLYRSRDNIDYIKIAQIPVEPNSSSYHFKDYNIEQANFYYYKLEIILHNSSKKTYGPKKIVLKKNDAGFLKSDITVSPNPFNPTTTLYVTLAQPDQGGKVCCKIFDCLGRKVATLSRQINSSGQFPLYWNGCDTQGRTVPSGIYFARLVVSDQVLATSRMVKLK